MAIPRPARTAAALAALLLSLAACSGAAQDPAPSSDGGGVEAADPTQDAPAGTTDAAPTPQAGTLTITHGGEESDFTPEIVRCEGGPGTIRHVALTMDRDEVPLVEVTPGEFAMVKLEREGAPEKSRSTEGITAENGEVTFDAAEIGGVVVDGTVTCPQHAEG